MRRKRSILLVPDSRAGSAPRPGGAADPLAPHDETDALAPFDPRERGEWWWRQPRRMRPVWFLETGGRTVARMERATCFAGIVLGRTTRVTFESQAFVIRHAWNGSLEVRRGDGVEALARYVPHWFRGGRIESGGETLAVKRTGFFAFACDVLTGDGLKVLRAEPRHGFFRFEARLLLEDATRVREDLQLLVAITGVLATLPRKHHHG
jgi:hypothetical protein